MGIGAALGAAGAAVASAVGATATTFISAAVVSAAVQGAIVGAVIGGLTSAVTGGNILQGVLIGAVGGAVTGGIMGAINPGAFAVNGTITTGEITASNIGSSMSAATDIGVASVGGVSDAYASAGATFINDGVTQVGVGAAGGAGGGASGFGGMLGKEVISQGIAKGADALLAGSAQEDAMEYSAAEAQKDRDAEMLALEKQLAANLQEAEIAAGSVQKSQTLASTLAQLTAQENLQQEEWKREDTAKAKMSAAAKSIARAGSQKGALNKLTAAEEQAIASTSEAQASPDYRDPEEVAQETMGWV